jgi:hypothetical protein
MRVLCAIVRTLIIDMLSRQAEGAKGDVIRPEFIGCDPRWRPSLLLQQFPHQLQRRPGVPLWLHEKIQDLTFVINGPP